MLIPEADFDYSLSSISDYFYLQASQKKERRLGSIEERKRNMARRLSVLRNTAWYDHAGANRIDIHVPEVGKVLQIEGNRRDLEYTRTTYRIKPPLATIEAGGRTFNWAVVQPSISILLPNEIFFEDAETRRIGVLKMDDELVEGSMSEVYDFFPNDGVMLAYCENCLAKVFYPNEESPYKAVGGPDSLFREIDA
jgi:hypothetical protein